jgi:hypothetical protein
MASLWRKLAKADIELYPMCQECWWKTEPKPMYITRAEDNDIRRKCRWCGEISYKCLMVDKNPNE